MHIKFKTHTYEDDIITKDTMKIELKCHDVQMDTDMVQPVSLLIQDDFKKIN